MKNKKSFLQTFKSILWSFVGLRNRRGYEIDNTSLNPIYVILAALISVIFFVIALLLIIKFFVL